MQCLSVCAFPVSGLMQTESIWVMGTGEWQKFDILEFGFGAFHYSHPFGVLEFLSYFVLFHFPLRLLLPMQLLSLTEAMIPRSQSLSIPTAAHQNGILRLTAREASCGAPSRLHCHISSNPLQWYCHEKHTPFRSLSHSIHKTAPLANKPLP